MSIIEYDLKNLPPIQNYHKHTDSSNIAIADSPVLIDAYAERCKEIGSTVLSSVEHSWQGRYHVVWECAKKNDLKFVFGTEAYWVKDRKTDDGSNCHIILLAKNENGRQDINEVLSIANEDGFYRQPRLDLELIMNKLTPTDVFITSSCFTDNMSVQTMDGYKKITDVGVGDKVFTHLGTWENVLNKTTRPYNDTLYKLKVEGNFLEIECTKDHKFPTIQKTHNNVTKEIIWKRADELTTQDRIVSPIDKRLEVVEYLDFSNELNELRTKHKRKRKRIKSDVIKVTNEFLELLGIYSAEGNFVHDKGGIDFTLNVEDTHIIEKVKRYMKDIFGIDCYEQVKKGTKALNLRYCSTEIFVIFNKLSKSGAINKNVPDFVKKLEPTVQMQYIKGLFNGDGHVHKKEPKINFTTISKELAYEVSNILERNGIKPSAYSKDSYIDKNGVKHKRSYTIEINSSEFYSYWKEFRLKSEDFTFDWTRETKWNSKKKVIIDGVEYIHKKIVGIKTEEYNGQVYCLNVNNTHSFKVEQIATHNCVAGWKYEDAEEIWLQIHKRFGDNFMLEVQYHNTPKQIELNKKILRMSKEYGIKIIMGLDSHYITESQSVDRDDLLASKCIKYHEDETGWYMDFPDSETCYKRFVEQGVLSHDEIIEAMQNTNVILDFEDIEFDRTLKLPTIFPDKTQEEKDLMYKRIIVDEWNKYKQTVPSVLHPKYIKEIAQEVSVVINTHMSDYFLLNYYLIKNAVARGGIITKTGRGSASSFFTNTLLGFSNIDRIVAPVTLYPDRFMSETRILKNNSSPDIDFNTYHTDIFIEEQTKLLGDGHSYPMIAFGKLRPKSAFKMYARSQGMNPDLANEISKEIAKYEKALNNADDDSKETMSIYDYIDEQYHSYIKASESYLGIVADKKISPCSHILYKGDIRREIGTMRLMNKSSKKVVQCACIEGHVADRFGFLKNDILVVSVWGIIENIYKRIGIKSHTINELSALIENDKETWDIYAKGLTVCINQCESVGTTTKVMKYKPKNISELTAFIAGIRPSFKSMYNIFESRKPFSYGIKAFDELIQTKEMPYSFVLYQEQMMNTLNYAGFDISECYDIIKAIAKKHPEKVTPLKSQFIKGFGDKIREAEPNLSEEEIQENCLKVWKIIEDSAGYGFNSSHALAYAYDSVYCAWLKAHYPYEFYTEILQTYSDKGEKDRVVKIIQEMDRGFGIKLGEYKFGLDNRQFVMDKEKGVIYPSLLALKNFNEQAGIDLYEIRNKKFNTFTELLIELVHNTSLDKTKINILIKLGYFSDFGKNKKLFNVYEQFQKRYKKTHVEKTRMARKLEMIEFEHGLKDESFGIKEQLKNEIEVLGYPITKLDKAPEDAYLVTEIDDKYSTRTITLYKIKTGEFITCKISKEDFMICPFGLASVMRVPELYTTKQGNYYLRQYSVIG